jgi:hypothetical protein
MLIMFSSRRGNLTRQSNFPNTPVKLAPHALMHVPGVGSCIYYFVGLGNVICQKKFIEWYPILRVRDNSFSVKMLGKVA